MAVFTDTFLYAVIVPVIPFALQSRLHTKEEDGKCRTYPYCNGGSDKAPVQSLVSILIAVYGGALAVVSRECDAAPH